MLPNTTVSVIPDILVGTRPLGSLDSLDALSRWTYRYGHLPAGEDSALRRPAEALNEAQKGCRTSCSGNSRDDILRSFITEYVARIHNDASVLIDLRVQALGTAHMLHVTQSPSLAQPDAISKTLDPCFHQLRRRPLTSLTPRSPRQPCIFCNIHA